MAGIYDVWGDRKTEERYTSFSIITTDTNSLTDYIQNTKHRMPAILSKEDEVKWLNPDLSNSEISALLKPHKVSKMDAYTIGYDFIKKKSTDKIILEKSV